ncbi:MAG: hypothetical protein IJU16_05280, partial [Clostridia bacterium]|nr:hypothetical protein [Clostridia bacterium]
MNRELQYTLAADGVLSPAMPQYGGTQGEHHTLTVSFSWSGTFAEQASAFRIVFRAGDGTVASSDL